MLFHFTNLLDIPEDFELEFNKKDSKDYAQVAVNRQNMTEFSLYIWLKTTSKTSSTIFSYATSSQTEEILLTCQDMQLCQLVIGGESR